MALGQKKAIVEAIKIVLPAFIPYKDIALIMLSAVQLEQLKQDISVGINQGLIEYSKDKNNHAEVMSYARSCVMNHLKKARELNGNAIYGGGTATQAKEPKNNSTIDKSLLTQALRDYVDIL